MTTAARLRIRHARRWTGYGLLVLLIALALMVGVANQLLPMVERHPDRIAAWLSERVGEPVSFSRASAEWTRRGPRFILEDLHVGAGARQLAVGRAQLQVAMYSGLLPGRPLTELKIRDLLLTLAQDGEGRWTVVGLPGQAQSDPLDRLEGFGELQIERAQLRIHAPRLKVDMQIPRVDARLRVNGPRLRVGVSTWAERGGAPLSAVLDVQRTTGNGLLWAGGDKLQLAQWHGLLAAIGVVPEQGTMQLGAWASLQDRKVVQLIVDADIARARSHSLQPLRLSDGSSRPARVDFDRLQALARWQVTRNGWQLLAPRLNVTKAGRTARLDQLLIDGGRQFRLVGPQLDLSPLADFISLSDRFPDPVRVFLQQSSPQAVLHEVRIEGTPARFRGTLHVSQLALKPFATRPGLSGVGGRVVFDQDGGVFSLSGEPVRFDWPAGLRQTLDLRLQGRLAAWRSGPGWTVGSDRLHLRGDGFGATVATELAFQGDRTAPVLTLSANVEPATFDIAKKFWILHKMPKSTIEWLDRALVSGSVQDARIAIAGDLDDWPFRNHEGSFDARARVRDGVVKFSPDWPEGQAMNLDLIFDGPGFSLEGTGNLLGNPVSKVSGGIADFHSPVLALDIVSDTRGDVLRRLMLASPLERSYGEHLRALTLVGKAGVAVQLALPLGHQTLPRRIEGTLDLASASLSDLRWGIAFTQASGRTRFTQDGFATQDLAVRLANQPGVFNLRVGKDAAEAGMAAVATLEGRFTAASLIDRYEGLAWLKPWMGGAAQWKLAVRVPAAQGKRQPASQLRVSSDLSGITLAMPEPLKKAASASLPLDLQLPLPIEQGVFNLRLGTLVRMHGVVPKNAPISAAMQFGEGALAPIPASGISARGSTTVIDSTGWVAFSGKGSSSASIHDVNMSAERMIFLDRPFADAKLTLDRGASSTSVVLKGKGIDGSVDIPSELSRGVQGRFAKLYLVSEAGVSGGAPAAESGVENPAELPPLRFSINDLRIGDAQLGKAELATTPIANGLRVDRFQTQAKNLSLNAVGDWVRAERGTLSSFKLNFTAASLGQMLDALGYKDIVQGGRTKASLAGSWPGSPGAFSLATMDGKLKVDVGEGRLLDVEPGGSGRVLGLISLAEIPRRLTLDFSDFFQKGFSFNTAQGDFAFADGKARTDNLRIDGPAAEIRVSGTTGMREQMYDQRVEVLPKAGGVLPAIGLLAGGPAGAAVGAMAQAVLQRPLKQTARVVYRVTGPWQKPVVKVIEKGPAQAANAVGMVESAPAVADKP